MYKQAAKFMVEHPDAMPVDLVGLIGPLSEEQRAELSRELDQIENARGVKSKRLRVARTLRGTIFRVARMILNREVIESAASANKKIVRKIKQSATDVTFKEISKRAMRYSGRINEIGLRREIARATTFVLYSGIEKKSLR